METINHKKHGSLSPQTNQKFVPYYRPDKTLQRVEVHENRQGINYRVVTYLSNQLVYSE